MAKKGNRLNRIIIVLFIITSLISLLILRAKIEKPRFSSDSLDNPQFKDWDKGSKPIILNGASDIGVLLVHGLGATAWETKALALYLNSKNITTSQVLLAGHDKSIYGLEQSKAGEWYKSLENDYDNLEKPKKFVIGLSIGALTSIELAQKKQTSGIILISPSMEFKNKLIKYSPFLQYFKRFSHRELEKGQQRFYYENFPVKTLSSIISYIRRIKAILQEVNAPLLIIQSKNDPRVDYKGAYYIYSDIGSANKEIMWLNGSTHIPIVASSGESQESKNERAMVFERIYSFILDNS